MWHFTVLSHLSEAMVVLLKNVLCHSEHQVAGFVLLLLATVAQFGAPVFQSPSEVRQIKRQMLLKAHVIEYPSPFLPPTLTIAKNSLLKRAPTVPHASPTERGSLLFKVPLLKLASVK